MQLDFSEKVVLISGGTSGIGLAAARQFIAAGALVALVGRDLQRGGDALGRLAGVGQEPVFFAGDVAKTADCDRVVEQTIAQFGRLDVLVYSAG